jgi:Matrixin
VGIPSPLIFANFNIARIVIAHEFGHAAGLDHNDDEAALMCGAKAWCQFNFRSDGTFPLTSDDKAKLLEMYPPNWQPTPPSRRKWDLPFGVKPG